MQNHPPPKCPLLLTHILIIVVVVITINSKQAHSLQTSIGRSPQADPQWLPPTNYRSSSPLTQRPPFYLPSSPTHHHHHRQKQLATGLASQFPPSPQTIRPMQPKRVCYFRMDPKTEIRLSQVDGSLCTHVIMAFARLDSLGNLCLARNDDLAYLLEVPAFKRQFPATKVMISVFNEEEHNGFPKAAQAADNRQRFARSSMDFLQQYHLDGLDLDWEFPNFPTPLMMGREHERQGLTKILKSLRSAIVENYYNRQVHMQQAIQMGAQPYMNHATPGSSGALATTVEPYLLTMAIAAQEAVLRASYELKQVANLCDWLNIMSYDYFLFKLYAPFTGPNSPLHSVVEPYVPIVNKLSISWTLSRLLEEGITRDKIVMGVPTYARAYRLMFRNSQPAPFTLAVGPKGGRIDDYLDYREVRAMLAKPDTIVEFDQRARVPYLLTDFGYTWVSYENEQSVREKVRYVLENQLAGYMTWNLNSDDFIGFHHQHQPAADDQPSPLNGHAAPGSGNQQELMLDRKATFPLHRAMMDEVRLFVAGG